MSVPPTVPWAWDELVDRPTFPSKGGLSELPPMGSSVGVAEGEVVCARLPPNLSMICGGACPLVARKGGEVSCLTSIMLLSDEEDKVLFVPGCAVPPSVSPKRVFLRLPCSSSSLSSAAFAALDSSLAEPMTERRGEPTASELV